MSLAGADVILTSSKMQLLLYPK